MQTVSYKDYLELFSKYHQSNIPLGKLFFALIFTILFTFGTAMAISNHKNLQQEPAQAQVNYVETANASFINTQQSLDDLFSSFQVAGAKIEKLDNLKESTASPGFFIALSETQNTIAKIQQAKDNIKYQKNLLQKTETPSIYSDLNSQIMDYYNQADSFLTVLERRETNLKDLIVATGPNFYLPVLSDESIWDSKDIEKIKEYYKNRKIEAKNSLENFQKIPISDGLDTYKDTQITYYNLLINVSDNILTVLKKAESANPDKSAVLEEAYQVLTTAKKDNEYIASQLLDTKLKVTSSEEYFINVNKLKDQKRIIESGFQSTKLQTTIQSDQNNESYNLLNITGLEKLKTLF